MSDQKCGYMTAAAAIVLIQLTKHLTLSPMFLNCRDMYLTDGPLGG